VVLVAAGLEPSGAAGLLADVAAVSAAGGRPLGVATALSAQGSRFALFPVRAEVLAAQLDAALEAARPQAVKLGLVPDARALAVLWRRVAGLGVPVVVDPVVRTSRGERLSRLTARDVRRLAAPQVWLNPNLLELAWLLGRPSPPRSLDEVKALGATLLADGFGALVVKGGHLPGPPVEVLLQPERVLQWRGTRLAPGRRGTGCRFASTLATALAQGRSAAAAVELARGAVRRYLGEGQRRPTPPARGSRSG
jgi:hydroxymethylpyrimidine/phosphomethylpyrimidine kinase